MTTQACGKRLEDWFAALRTEKMKPADEDMKVLRKVAGRILIEFSLYKEGCDMPKSHMHRQDLEEPLRGFVHGPPGTGKSRLIYWMCRCFKEALGWEHRKEFICIAYQHRVTHGMGGISEHIGGDLGVGEFDNKLEHTGVDVLFSSQSGLTLSNM